ncbi:MAG: hypothetical protein QGI21_04070 [Candidatus Poseidoniaceae archaeon]|nr:hypothetical protein [Candidatus Poseidoniaceae archaeon]
MRVIPVLLMVGLLLLPGCTYLDEYTDDSELEDIEEPVIELKQGCTDPEANNYDETAEEDDGSCEYDEPEPILGCTDPDAENYNETADQDDGTCEYLETIPCNGLVILCHRTYDQVTFPETHNSFSTHEDNIYYPASNHKTGFQAQWNAGMRAFMLDTHYLTNTDLDSSSVRFCHGDSSRGISPCTYGAVDPWNWLGNLKSEMESEERDIVTLLVENHVEPTHLKDLFDDVGLTDWMYIHQMNEDWPTLIELINVDKRLVVFWEQSSNPSYPQFHDFLTHSWTTDYAEENKEDMDCEPLRGDSNQVVFHMNNWLSVQNGQGLSDPSRSAEANDVDFLVERAIECIELYNKRPTFIAVDWWEDGDVVKAARLVNEMELDTD